MNIFDKTIQETTKSYNKSIEVIIFKKLSQLEELCKNKERILYDILNNYNLQKNKPNILYIKSELEKNNYKLELVVPEMDVETIKSPDGYIVKTNIDEDKIKLTVSKLIYEI